ncbi:MAG: histidine phosphotransferase family protein [Sulfitobacter sp.]|uniref:histidine phosphotransferase family protein n=1 Tax=Sulfitobacter sp. TaxID=1903071 RepID=UPI004058E186|tara:strand:+ start:1476 stop:2072 length:597 start_codon:yes stop_codon:yes gene_type:complete
MADSENDLAALIGSRVCHDLISPIGAINNGLELVAMSGNVMSQEMELIAQSVNNASARIRLFRIAFGVAGEQLIGRAEIVSILTDLYAQGRMRVTWDVAEPQPRQDIRLAFLAVLCLETGMPYGGNITVSKDGANWQFVGTAEKLLIDPDLWQLLGGGPRTGSLEPRHVQFGLLPGFAHDAGRKIKSSADETDIKLTF